MVEFPKKIYNFSAGPCVLPQEVLKQAQENCVDTNGAGVSVLEMSHRSKPFVSIVETAEKDLRDFLCIPDDFTVLFLGGGASLQFSAIPYNLLGGKTKANYLTTGNWSQSASKDASKLCSVVEAWPDSGSKFNTIPDPSKWIIDNDSAYFHYCLNETIYGVEFHDFPYDKVTSPLVSDMSSAIGSRNIDWDKHAVIYAGA